MAESVVSFATQHIDSMIKEEANCLADMEPELGELHSELKKIKEYLTEADRNKELTSNEQVRSWLVELGRIAYDAEDMVDTFVSDSERLFKLPRTRGASNQLRKLRLRMQEVKSKLDRSEEGTTDSKKERRSWARGSQASKGHLHPDDGFVVGIDGDVNMLVKKLLGKSDDDQPPVNVLAIVGMGGSGKTTLARQIYHHQRVEKDFECRAWVPLFQGWDAPLVMSEILRQINNTSSSKGKKSSAASSTDEGFTLEVFGCRFRNSLRGKLCLVVLDDMWDSEMNSLHQILPILIQCNDDGVSAVKIVITSRNRVLSRHSHLNWCFHMKQCLSNEDSWELFSKVAPASKISQDYQVLALEMLKKCQGLPLAIVALAKLLKTKDTIQEWKMVYSQIESAEGSYLYQPINDILSLSYDELPYYLKPCFLYLGLFQEGSSIPAGSLIRRWIAEGFVCVCQEETLEDAGRRQLQELVNHTMVEVVKRNYAGKVKTIRVHDIMRDLCIMKARDLDFLTVYSSNFDVNNTHSRRASVNLSMCVNPPIQNSHLRSLLLYGQSGTGIGDVHASKGHWATLNLTPVCENFKLLRVLDIIGIKSSTGILPKQVGNLIHLRYLRIRSTNIRVLPKSIGNLRNLLTLDYWNVAVDKEIKLPNVLWKLRRLRHLYLPNEMSSMRKDLKLHDIRQLQTLWGVGGGNWMLRGMKMMSPALKKLCIQGISSREQLQAVFDCPVVKRHDCLHALALDWYGFELDSLDALSSKHNLQKLRLLGKTNAPDKLKPLTFPSNLLKLELNYTRIQTPETMETLGKLCHLKVLKLSKDSFVGSEWTCFNADFPKLEELKLCYLPELADWEMETGTMPCLKKLSIISCKRLKSIPQGLKLIHTLEKLELERMPHNFCGKLQHPKEHNGTNTGGEDFHIVQHIPYIRVHDPYSSFL